MVSMPWFHHVFGAGPTSSGRGAAAPRLPRLALRLLARSTAFPRPEDSDQGSPAPRTDSSRRSSYLDTDPDHCQTATRQLPTRSPGDAAVPGGIPQWPLAPGVIAPVPGIMRLFWAFSPSTPPESPSQEDSSLANMLDTLEARCRSDGPPAGPRSIDPLPGSRSFLTVSAVA